MVTDAEHKKQIARAYQVALSRLRQQYDAEFHAILSAVYEEQGITVRKRMSRAAARQQKMEQARAVLQDAGDPA